ncbi:uncharacterized protein [Macrobrachium rosenbergii]|uniref:uncharacterized protein n=1 Tax=Macrobrachium rosenbergii TaxID=79674 RepID=UPI0034D63F2E
MEHEIDIDLLISLVETKPVLWDKSLEDYKSRNLTMSAWMEVCRGLYDGFDQLSDKEKDDYGRLVYKRWRNVKDNWLKARRKASEQRKAGSGVKAAKNYIYNEQLCFLKKNLDSREIEESFSVEETDNNGSVVEEESDAPKTVKESGSAAPRSTKGSNKRKLNDAEEMLMERLIKTLDAAENRHLSFFKGIVPSLEKFSEDETIQFQLGVLNLLQNIRQPRSLPQPLHSKSQPQHS